MDLRDKRVTVIGAARSGLAAVRLAHNKGARVTLSDAQPLSSEIRHQLPTGVATEEGHTRATFVDSDLVVVSPGVPWLAQPLVWARENGVPVWSEIELAYRYCPCPVIAITGSNGKTTVSTMIAKLLQDRGADVCLCGNIGAPFSDYVERLTPSSWVVLEVSSFQLENIVAFRPHIGVWLNFSQNHLDRHADLQEYFTAKCRLFENMRADDYAVLSDDGQFREWAATITPAVMLYNAPGKLFSRNPNHLAVKQVADILNIPDEEVRALCDGFCGVEHRMERVAVIDDVAYVNDSKSTTVEATRWALERVDGGIRLIAGGRDKQLDFAPLKGLVAEKVRTLIVIGEAAEKLASVFRGETEILPAASLAEAVYAARSLASSGETVLLSPMCASFDMFKNFEDRGKVFKEIVREMEASLKAG